MQSDLHILLAVAHVSPFGASAFFATLSTSTEPTEIKLDFSFSKVVVPQTKIWRFLEFVFSPHSKNSFVTTRNRILYCHLSLFPESLKK
jgi:hypothetical protein